MKCPKLGTCAWCKEELVELVGKDDHGGQVCLHCADDYLAECIGGSDADTSGES